MRPPRPRRSMGTAATMPTAAAARCDKEATGSKKPGMARMKQGPDDKSDQGSRADRRCTVFFEDFAINCQDDIGDGGHRCRSRGDAVRRGVLSALLAALTFGATTPVIALAGRAVGPFTTAALLYAGAVCGVLLQLGVLGRAGPALRVGQWRRVALVAVFGAAIAPTLLAWGLRRTGGTTGSLLLNLEAVFTVLLARAFYQEPIGRRVAAAIVLMVAAGALLAADVVGAFAWSGLGAGAVALATVAWAVDNALTRPLAEADPVL